MRIVTTKKCNCGNCGNGQDNDGYRLATTEPTNTGIFGNIGTVQFSMDTQTLVSLFVAGAALVFLSKKIK